MSRSALAAVVAAAALLLPACGMADELSGPSPVPRSAPTDSSESDSGDGAPGDLLPGDATTDPGQTSPPPDPSEDQGEGPELGAPGIPACDVLDLPATALPVIEDIEAGGPYDYPRNDGVRFQNREQILPDEDRDYYREFTVETPGSTDRGARRLVVGGCGRQTSTKPVRITACSTTNPIYWTDDHYESFRRVL